MDSAPNVSESMLYILSTLRHLSRNGPLQLNQVDAARLLQDLETVHNDSLVLEAELESLCKVRDFIKSVSKTDIRFTHPEKHRAAFSVVRGTDAPDINNTKEIGNAR